MRLKQTGGNVALLSIAASTLATWALAESVDVKLLQFVDIVQFAAIQNGSIKANGCPAGYFSCADKGDVFAGTCCQDGQVCSLDAYKEPACCPTTATCTGVAPSNTQKPSYVSNSYFSFPYIRTSFSDQAACTSAVSQCNSNYNACVTQLASNDGGYGVTVNVPGGGGTTVAATATGTLPTATAISVCSSLSSEACYNLKSSRCSSTGFILSGHAAARPTAACMAGVVAGVGLGIMGQL
ncbi:hypothetical protein F4780DRAFT_332169 [Xylariomycetidae sp. FL0641]|nr:hypothetical protein F4780DRAFT_332169 [Xylariomycetidae sp. FL0641]